MSFKREGDDKSQLNILKKRRVADLLSSFIPEDEAALLKNGRYTCLVCSYRPVFDTVGTLSVHRKGRRHLEGLKSFYGKKTRLKNEITKRRQEIYVQKEDMGQGPSCSAPLLAQTQRLTHHALLRTSPYDSCHRRTSTKHEKQQPVSTSAAGGNKSGGSSSEPERVCQESFSNSLSESRSSGGTALKDLKAAGKQEAVPLTAQRRSELEHYLKLKSQGWLKDRSGQWVKDQSVEFDSDEEEPPSLAPPTHESLR
ncbi:sodium channel modifier 1 isoform X2 [Antennarius striatus]|uniref:sodium channel modifier 1 isoform X2 n=1 Tax=Antennarius striatus TaxID=241820 RepID=UPI0035B4C868